MKVLQIVEREQQAWERISESGTWFLICEMFFWINFLTNFMISERNEADDCPRDRCKEQLKISVGERFRQVYYRCLSSWKLTFNKTSGVCWLRWGCGEDNFAIWFTLWRSTQRNNLYRSMFSWKVFFFEIQYCVMLWNSLSNLPAATK